MDAACEDPRKRLPMEQMDNSRSELLPDGWNVGAWTIGNTG